MRLRAVVYTARLLKGDAYVRIAVGVANPLGPEKTLAADAVAKM